MAMAGRDAPNLKGQHGQKLSLPSAGPWKPLSLSDASKPLASMRLARPASATRSPSASRLREPLQGAGAALTRGTSSTGFRDKQRLSGKAGGESFFELLADSRKKSQALHSDPFDTLGPKMLSKKAKVELRPLEFSLHTGDTLHGFTRGCRAAFKSTGNLATVLRAGPTKGMIEVQLDAEDAGEEGEVATVRADSLMLPTREELLALEVRKHKTDV